MDEFIKNQIEKSIKVKESIVSDKCMTRLIKDVSLRCAEVYINSKKTLIAGNGGSAADAQHIAGEFVSRFYFDRPGLPSMALTTDTSILTGVGNDYGYEQLFARQLSANGTKGDMFIAISTSGNSINIVEALIVARQKGLITVGLTGKKSGQMDKYCDYCIKINSEETPRIQEAHILIGHIICSVVEEVIFGREYNNGSNNSGRRSGA